jgi:hypothetical protein
MKIQYVSNIHLEYNENYYPTIKAVAPILCLVGNIGNPNSDIYLKFLIYLNSNEKFEKIFLIAGNCEYYNTFDGTNEINKKIKYMIMDNNLHKIVFLHDDYDMYLNYLFIGLTFRTKICENSIEYLKKIVRLNHNKKIIVMSYFLPLSNLDEIIKEPIVMWIYGCANKSNQTIINGVKLVCNPIEYNNKNAKYDEYIELKDSEDEFDDEIENQIEESFNKLDNKSYSFSRIQKIDSISLNKKKINKRNINIENKDIDDEENNN